MRNKIVIVLMILVMFSTIVYAAGVYNKEEIDGFNLADISLNGELSVEKDKGYVRAEDKKLLPSTINWDGTMYVPLRLLSELLGARVGWDGSVLIDLPTSNKDETATSELKDEAFSITFENVVRNDLSYNGKKKTVYFEANPDKGFNYPYVIILPGHEFKSSNNNNTSKKYLMVEPNNFGRRSEDMTAHTIDVLTEKCMSFGLAKKLHLPVMIPIFPNTGLRTYDRKALYEHSLNRYTVTVEDNYKEYLNRAETYTEEDIKKMFDLEKQLYAMIEDAKDNLQNADWNVEEKIFMYGWSASGKFTNRYSFIYPEQIKAVYSGAMGGTVQIPAKEYNGMQLPYTVGIYDFFELFGKEFNFEAYNNMAKMFYIGGIDTNDVYTWEQYFSDDEITFIDYLGWELYPTRWENTQKVFSEVGGKGMFLVNLNKGHGRDYTDESVTKDFFMQNRNSERPIYPDASGFTNLVQNIYE